jgi:hypothetical protein
MSEEGNEPIVEPAPEPAPENPELVKYKNDMFKYKRELQDSQKKIDELVAQQNAAEEARLLEGENFKGLYEKTKEELDRIANEKKSIVESVMVDKKLSAVREFAAKNGITDEGMEDLEMLNMDDVVVETTSEGRINVHGADSWVENLKSRRPNWFGGKNPPNINNGTGNPALEDRTYSPRELLELQAKNPAMYRKIMTEKQNLIRR